LLILGVGGGGTYFMLNSDETSEDAAPRQAGVAAPAANQGSQGDPYAIDTSGPPEIVGTQNSSSQGGVTVNASVEFGVWTSTPDYASFIEKFRACEPAAIRMVAMGEMIFEYRILGNDGGQCKLEMRMVKNPIPMFASWVGKSMECPCDNSKDFMRVTEELSPEGIMNGTLQCEGPLFDAMKTTLQQMQ